jgi:glycosyltransferase involved in cell wall biosynthesis
VFSRSESATRTAPAVPLMPGSLPWGVVHEPGIHIFEPTGFGGIFQHSCALGQLLTANGVDVTLHTSSQHEEVELDGVRTCRCIWWPRGGRSPRARKAAIAARYMSSGLAHLDRAAAAGDVVHVQGGQASGFLAAATLAVAGRRGRRVVYSPHNTFSRGGAVDAAFQRLCLSLADVVVGYSDTDVEALEAMGSEARMSPLIQLVPRPSDQAMDAWRETWTSEDDEDVVLFAGQIRSDKRLDVLIESAADWPEGRRLAVVGEDRGAWDDCAELAENRDVDIAAKIGFVALDDFTAAIAAADVLVAPYDRASQSGVLSIARQLGVRTIASDIGGLGELAERTVAPNDVDGLTEAIDAELTAGALPAMNLDEDLALSAHASAYALDHVPMPGATAPRRDRVGASRVPAAAGAGRR